ncbi:MAG: hypothetical protein ABFS02_02205 [Pseudomonadota bacterium]
MNNGTTMGIEVAADLCPILNAETEHKALSGLTTEAANPCPRER